MAGANGFLGQCMGLLGTKAITNSCEEFIAAEVSRQIRIQ
jgi:hypothetical protein